MTHSPVVPSTSAGSVFVEDRDVPQGLHLGFEGNYVPQMSDEERRIGFNGTKLEDVNKTSFFGRLRGSVGLGTGLGLELGWTPPVEVGGAKPNILALALGRPVELSPAWRLGVRGYGQLGTIEGDITCSASEVAAGDDVQANRSSASSLRRTRAVPRPRAPHRGAHRGGSRRGGGRRSRALHGEPGFRAHEAGGGPGQRPEKDIPKVEERMRGPEVLEVSRYPEIRFASTSVRGQAKDGGLSSRGR